MSFLAKMVAPRQRKAVGFDELWEQLVGGTIASKAGPAITRETVFRVGAAFACMNVIARGCAQVPFKLYQETQGAAGKTILPARDHLAYDLTASDPNDWQTSFELRETIALHACLGNAYIYKVRDSRGQLIELIPLQPNLVHAEQGSDWKPVYRIQGRDGSAQTVGLESIWHVRGPSWDGFLGMDVLKLAREALGLSLALEESHAALHANSVRPSGIYTVDATLSPQQYEQLTAWIKKHASLANTGRPLVLDRSAKWISTAMNGVDAQHVETRDHQVQEVCRFFGVYPAKIGFSDKTSTHASAEQFAIQHVVDTLGPWYARIEQSADKALLTRQERRAGYYFKFNAAGLLRGAAKDRGEFYARALGSGGHPGWMTPNEVRALEELNPLGGAAAELPPGANQANQAAPANAA